MQIFYEEICDEIRYDGDWKIPSQIGVLSSSKGNYLLGKKWES